MMPAHGCDVAVAHQQRPRRRTGREDFQRGALEVVVAQRWCLHRLIVVDTRLHLRAVEASERLRIVDQVEDIVLFSR